jgi:hypothetical protein
MQKEKSDSQCAAGKQSSLRDICALRRKKGDLMNESILKSYVVFIVY